MDRHGMGGVGGSFEAGVGIEDQIDSERRRYISGLAPALGLYRDIARGFRVAQVLTLHCDLHVHILYHTRMKSP